MKKLTAEKCCQLLDTLNSNGMSILEGYYAEALEIALPILEQQERGESVGDWIEWGGGERPVIASIRVDIKFRDGDVGLAQNANWDWRHHGYGSDIIAYRIIPERATNQNGEQ